MSFRDTLKAARLRAGLTQQDVADRMGITKSTYCGYETGKRQPDVQKIKDLARLFGVSGDELLETGYGTQTKKAPSISDEAKRFAKRYDRLDQIGRGAVAAILEYEEERMSVERVPDNVIPIPCSIQRVSAGTGAYLGPEEFETIFVQRNEITQRASFAVPVHGDSMEPRFHDGDVLLVERRDDIERGQIGVFTVDGDGYVKERGDGELLSLNAAYAPVPLTDDSWCNGLVIGVLDPAWRRR